MNRPFKDDLEEGEETEVEAGGDHGQREHDHGRRTDVETCLPTEEICYSTTNKLI